MPVRSYFNDPGIAAAAGNLAQLFAPPSGADAAGWAAAKAEQEKAKRLADFYSLAQDPNSDWSAIDRMGVGAGVFNPTQTMQRVQMDDLTTRRGQDVSAATQRYGYDTQAATSRSNNALDNQRAAITSLFGALNEGQIRPAVPEELMGAIGLPAIGAVQGLPKPLTMDQLNAQTAAGLSPELREALAFGSTPVENVVGPNGPVVATRPQAIGQQPFINEGATAKPTNATAVLPDGTQVPAVQDHTTGRWRHAQTGEELPANVRLFNMAQPQGTSDEVGLTTAVTSGLQGQIIALDQTVQTAQQLRDLIAASPSSQGLVGSLRGTAQDLMQTGGELGRFFGGQIEQANEAMRQGLLDAGAAAEFDPNIPAIQMLTNLLAWQYAKGMSGDRVSNEQLRAARDAIGGTGLFANQANSLARLNHLIQSLDQQRVDLRSRLPQGNVPGGTAPQPGGNRMRFDENGNPLP